MNLTNYNNDYKEQTLGEYDYWNGTEVRLDFVAPCDGYIKIEYLEGEGDVVGSDVDGYKVDDDTAVTVDDKVALLSGNNWDFFYDHVLDRDSIRDLESNNISEEEVKRRAAPNLYSGSYITTYENFLSDDYSETTVYGTVGNPNGNNLPISAGSTWKFRKYTSVTQIGDSSIDVHFHFRIVFVPKK